MSGLFGKNSVSSSSPVISSMSLQTSCYGRPIPWVFGQTRIAPNLIQYDDFTSHASNSGGSSGKGGHGAQGSTSYTYTVAAIMALSSGTIASIGQVWKDKDITSLSALALDFYSGTNTQTAYPYFATKHPGEALPYRGIAYVASGNYALGSDASLGNHTFEVQAEGSIASRYKGSTVPDAEVADVVSAILTDTTQGIGLDPTVIADLSQFRAFCLANNVWVSPGYTEQKNAYDYLKNLMTIGFADCVYSGGKFKVVPYSDTAITGQLATYTPNVPVVANLDEDDFIGDENSDAIQIAQQSADTQYNQVQVKFSDRANSYNDNIAVASDQADINLNGLVPMDVVELPEICDANVAQMVANFILQRALYIQNTYTFQLSWKWITLEPMDVVTLNYAAKCMVDVPVLITAISEDENGLLTVTAEDYPLGTVGASTQAVPNIANSVPNYASAPGNSNPPVVFEPPGGLTGGAPQTWLATSGGSNWGGCVVWASTDNLTYQELGTIRAPANHGVLSAALPAGALTDSIDTLSVNLAVSDGVLNGTSPANAADLVNLSYVDGEYIAFANATLTGQNAYSLSHLVRGAYNSEIATHAAGSQFALLDSAVFKYTYPNLWAGKTIYLKLPAFNVFGNSLQDLSQVPAYEHVIAGSPPVIAVFLKTVSLVFAIEVDWGLPADPSNIAFTELWVSDSANSASRTKLDGYAAPQASHTITGLKAGQVMYFWVRFIDKQGNVGNFYPNGDGVQGETATDAAEILSYLTGVIGQDQLTQDLLAPIQQISGLQSMVVNVEQLIEALPPGADVQQMIAQQSGALGLMEALAADQLIALVTGDQSLTETRTALTSQIGTNSAAIALAQQSIVNNQEAAAQSVQTLQAQFNNSLSVIQNSQTVLSNEQGALSSSVSTMQANFNGNIAAIQSQATATSNQLGTVVTQVDTLQTSLGNAEAQVQTSATALTQLNGQIGAMYTIKVAVTSGGQMYMAGIGVGVDNSTGVEQSQVLVAADRFAVINEANGTMTTPFVIQNGQTFMSDAFIADASITGAKITNLGVTTLQIANNAVTIPVGATASGTPASVSVTMPQAGMVQVIGFINFGNNTSAGQSVLLQINGQGNVGISVSQGYSGSASTSAIFSVGAGTTTFALQPSMAGCTLETNSIIAIGIMK